MLISVAACFAALCFGLALICNLWCVLRAESLSDQVLALDTMTLNAIALIVLMGLVLGRQFVFEVAVLFALGGFIGTVAYSRAMLRGDIIE